MDLGEVFVRTVGTNYLRQAVCCDNRRSHRSHVEVTWTDGHAVYLSTVHVGRQDIYATEQLLSRKSLRHENPIFGTVWSCEDVTKDINRTRYLAVFSCDRVSVWSKRHLQGTKIKHDLILVEDFEVQTCTPQGCSWHPKEM